MSKQIEALKLALEALERLALPKNADDIFIRAITAIKESLAQPEQSSQQNKSNNYLNGYCTGRTDLLQEAIDQAPVAYMYDRARYGPTDLRGQQWLPELSRLKPYTGNDMVRGLRPLYTHPIAQTWVGLPESAFAGMTLQQVTAMKYAEQILKDQNT